MSGENTELLIGSRESEFLCVRPNLRAHPDTHDYWDANWLTTEIELAASAFRAFYLACLRVDELIRFRDQLTALYQTLDGHAEFTTLDDWLSIDIVGDGLGHFATKCKARDDVGFGNSLRFSLHFDQTQIPEIVNGLNQTIDRFPLIGNRDA